MSHVLGLNGAELPQAFYRLLDFLTCLVQLRNQGLLSVDAPDTLGCLPFNLIQVPQSLVAVHRPSITEVLATG